MQRALWGPGAAAPQTHVGLDPWPVWPVPQRLPVSEGARCLSLLLPATFPLSQWQQDLTPGSGPTFHLQTSTPSSRPLSGSMMSGRRGAVTSSSCWWATRRTWPTRGKCRLSSLSTPLHPLLDKEFWDAWGASTPVCPVPCMWERSRRAAGGIESPGKPLPMSSLRPHLYCQQGQGRGAPLRVVCMEPRAPGPAQQCVAWELATTNNTAAHTAVPWAPADFCLCFVSLPL